MRIDAVVNETGRARDGLADIRVRTESGQEYTLDLPFRGAHRRFGNPATTALDLLVTASVCYIGDKTVGRNIAVDAWTRELDVHLPVSDVKRWACVSGELADTLTFLTGDVWRLNFYESPVPFFDPPETEATPEIVSADAVSLFSGGLDSLAGAIDLLADQQFGRVVLLGHYDSPGARKAQSDLAAGLWERYPERLDVLHIRVAHRPRKAVEESLRCRSFLFLALGLYAARAFGDQTPLYVFENGLIALNVPLTPSRRGSCSTRTMHPYYLARLRQIVSALGLSNPILTPYMLKTKGECVMECKNGEALRALVNRSVSCSHSFHKQDWARKDSKNCGYCVPCIFRRAALHRAGIDSGEDYGLDVLKDELTVKDQLESANDLRAVADFLRSPVTPARLRKMLLATAQFSEFDEYVQMACRGFDELKNWLRRDATSPSDCPQ